MRWRVGTLLPPGTSLRRPTIAILVGLLIASAGLAVIQAYWAIRSDGEFYWAEAGRRVWTGGLYDENDVYAFRYSPLFAYAMGPLSVIGYRGWQLVHLAALLALPRRIALLTLISWPFWYDVISGNTVVFVLVAATAGLSGRRWGAVVFLVMTVLMPRPFMFPLAAWFLWRDRALWAPFAAFFGVHAIAVVLTGWGDEWIQRLLLTPGTERLIPSNLSPTHWLGWGWMPFSILLAWLAWRRGWRATASVLVNPYWFPYYFMLPYADLAAQPTRASDRRPPAEQLIPATSSG
jgi:hypothetical protein